MSPEAAEKERTRSTAIVTALLMAAAAAAAAATTWATQLIKRGSSTGTDGRTDWDCSKEVSVAASAVAAAESS